MKKRMISMLLAILLVVGMLPTMVLAAETEAEEYEITLAQVEMGNALTLYFLFPVDVYADWTGCYAVVTKTYADGRDDVTVTIPATEWENKTSSGVEYKRVAFDGIAAKEMGDEVQIVLYNADNVAIARGGDSISGYLYRLLGKNNNPTFRCLAIDLLIYGADAQRRFAYNEENLVDDDLTWETMCEEGSAWYDAVCSNAQVKSDTYRGTSVSLENKIVMNFYFLNQTADMTAIATFTNYRKQEYTVELTSTLTKSGYCFVLDELVLADTNVHVTVTCYDADGNVYGSVTDDIESYIARTDMWDRMNQSILKIGWSARDYLK